MTDNTVMAAINGKWFRIPALRVGEKSIIVKGHFVKLAVVHDEEWLTTELEDPELCVKKLKEESRGGLRADILTFTQKVPFTNPKYPFHFERDSVAAIRVHSFEDWWNKLPQESRKNVRRSQKRGVVVEVKQLDDQLIEGIVGVNNDSPLRQGYAYAHFGKSFEQVKQDQTPFLDRSHFICAFLGDEMIGFMKIIYRGEVASILQFLTKASHRDSRPANALLAKAVQICEAEGVSHLTYGKYNYGNKTQCSLREFKIRNGFEEILVPRFYVPITKNGAIYLKLKLYRGCVGIFPSGIIKIGVQARAKINQLLYLSRKSQSGSPNSVRHTECPNPSARSAS